MSIMSSEEFLKKFRKPKRSKYNVAPAEDRRWNGRTYDSKAEMLYAIHLEEQRALGVLIEIVAQPRIWLGVPENVYVPDFLVIPAGLVDPHYIDVKGAETPAFKKVKKLWKAYGRIPLKIVVQKGRSFVTAEIIKSPNSSQTPRPLPSCE